MSLIEKTGSEKRLAQLRTSTAMAIALSFAALPAVAQTWDAGAATTNWSDANNWNPDGVPVAAGNVIINNGALASQPTLNVNSANLTSTSISAGTLTVDATLNSTTVTLTGTGNMTINVGREVRGSSTPTNTIVSMGSLGLLENNGTITGNLSVTNGTVDNGGIVSGTTTVSGGTLNLNAGTNLADGNSVTVSGSGILTVNAPDTVSTVNQTGGTINGSGVLTATGAFTQSGGATGGSVTISSATFTQSGGANIASGTTVTSSGAQALQGGTIAGNLNGTGAITAASGITGITGTVTDATSLTVSGGTVNVTGSGSVDTTGNLITISAGTLSTDGNGIADNETVSITGPGSLNVTGAETIAALNQGAGVVDGNATLTVAGAFTQSGGATGGSVTISSGTFTQSGGANIASGTTVTSSGAQSLQGGTISGNLNGAGAITAASGITDIGGAVTNAASFTVSGGTVNVTSAGTIDTSGNLITVSAGTLTTDTDTIASDETVAVSGTGTFTSSGTDSFAAINQSGGTVNGSGVLTLSGAFTQSGGTTGGTVQIDSATFTQSGGATLAAGTSVTSTGTQTLQGGTIAGTLDGAGAITVNTGTTTISGTTTSSSVTIQSGGTLEVENGSAIDDGANVAIDNGGIFTVNDVEIIGNLSSTDTLTSTAVINLNTGSDLAMFGSANTIFDGNVTGDGRLTYEGTGSLTLTGANAMTGLLVSSGANGGGELAITGAGTVAAGRIISIDGGLISSDGGAFASNADFEIDATSTVTVTGSEEIGALLGNGTADMDGTVNINGVATVLTLNGSSSDSGIAGLIAGTGTLNVTGGTTTVRATGDVQTATTIGASGTVVNDGTMAAVDNEGSFTNNLTADAVTNSGTGTNNGTIASLANTGGTFDNTLTITGLANITGGTFTTTGTVSGGLTNDATTNAQGTINGTIANNATGIFNLTGALTGDGAFTNDGTFNVNGSQTLTLSNPLGMTNNGSINLEDGAADDTFTLNGDLAASGTFDLDLNLNAPVPTVDTVVVNGALTGTINVNFNSLGPGTYDTPGSLVVIQSTDNSGSSIGTITGLPLSAFVNNQFIDQGNNYVILTSLNLGPVGGLVGSLTASQNLINAAVNRPSSAFVATPVGVEADTCAPGMYTRLTGGSSEAETTTTSPGSTAAVSNVKVTYGGLQVGVDYGCFNLGGEGGAVNFGLIGGLNTGNTKQDDPVSMMQNIVSDNDFNSRYVGAYATYAKGKFFADVQAVVDWTNVDINSSIGAVPFVVDPDFDSRRITLSGSMGYAFSIEDYSVVPSVGLSYSRTESDNVILAAAPGGTLVFEDIESVVGFASVSVAKTIILPDQKSAIQPFVTATIYNDFADASVINYIAPSGSSTPTFTENLGTYGEISAGINYRNILNKENGPLRDVTASLRGDVSFSDRLLGGRVTANLRLQF